MRHGETDHNVKGIWSCDSTEIDPLTDQGVEQVKNSAKDLKNQKIDVIVASPYSRTQQTAQVLADAIGLDKEKIISDPRLGEWNVGKQYDRLPIENFFSIRNSSSDRYHFKTEDGESYADIYKRAGEFIYEIDKKYAGKNILIVSHGAVTRALMLLSEGNSFDTMLARTRDFRNFENAEIRAMDFYALPHNEEYELDLHRPYIDEIVLDKDSKEYHRVKEVMDVWFDSGSMPFAQEHYPFQNKEWLENKGYPADFISEAIDQTRGWFYTLHAVGVLMGRGKAYKNVICLGHILDAEGKKMSKSIGNTVDPWQEMDSYGVDTLRLWMFSVNQPGDSKNYDQKTVVELNRQVFGLLYNVLAFYELYRDKSIEENQEESGNILDQWIISRFNQLIEKTTSSLDDYKLMEPVRAIKLFLDDLSTWYLRRSRERIKDGEKEAKSTLYFILKNFSVIFAPFAPFAAEDIWLKLRNEKDEESVHLKSWPNAQAIKEDVLNKMETVREFATKGNMLRKQSNIPVRQPLSKITIPIDLPQSYLDILKDELNVKDIEIGPDEVTLDFEITPELKTEGEYRELVRLVQDLRKEKGLSPGTNISIQLPKKYQAILESFMDDFRKTVQAKDFEFTKTEKIIISVS